MALLSELVEVCEKHRVDTRATLTVFARRLREAGRLSQAGRGRGAAHMTFLDAARFLIACAATDHPERAVDAEFVFSGLVRGSDIQGDETFPFPKDESPTLDLAMAKLLEIIASGDFDRVDAERWNAKHPGIPRTFPPFAWLVVHRSGSAALRVLNGHYAFDHPALAAAVESLMAGTVPAQNPATEALERETYRFRTGKNLIAELKADLLRDVANLISAPRRGGKAFPP